MNRYCTEKKKKRYEWPASMKRGSMSPAIKQMQIETTRSHFTGTRMTTIKTTDNKCGRGCEKTGTLIHCHGDCKMIQGPIWKTVWQFPHSRRRLKCMQTFIIVFVVDKKRKQPKSPLTSEWMRTEVHQ